VELRQYRLRPNQRDTLVELFDREFIDPQEVLGMRVIGQFRDLDDPDRFVWLRGFSTMEDRLHGLTTFYDGPTWRAHRAAANATMVDSDNVLLLCPARVDSAFDLDDRPGRNRVDGPGGDGFVVATIVSLGLPDEVSIVVEMFERSIVPSLGRPGATLLGYFVTEPSENTFPILPVREGEHVFVSVVGAGGREQLDHICDPTRRAWVESATPTALAEILRLEPTSRSSLTGKSIACSAVRRLGLAISSGVANHHGGNVTASDSRARGIRGRGTSGSG
jgi:hypothetical protein